MNLRGGGGEGAEQGEERKRESVRRLWPFPGGLLGTGRALSRALTSASSICPLTTTEKAVGSSSRSAMAPPTRWVPARKPRCERRRSWGQSYPPESLRVRLLCAKDATLALLLASASFSRAFRNETSSPKPKMKLARNRTIVLRHHHHTRLRTWQTELGVSLTPLGGGCEKCTKVSPFPSRWMV